MDQSCTLKRLVLLASQTLACESAQFGVNDRDQGFPCRSVALAPSREQLGHVVGRRRAQSRAAQPKSGQLAKNSIPADSQS
jgi:hypothetical protein